MSAALEGLYDALAEADFSPCDGCSACCEGAWLLAREADKARAVDPAVVIEDRGVAFLGDGGPCPWRGDGRCARYALRPLDCRLFPLDLIEHDGELWWCVFLGCVRPDALAERLIPRIEAIEAAMTPEILAEFVAQIAVTRERYPGYARGAYRLVRRMRDGCRPGSPCPTIRPTSG